MPIYHDEESEQFEAEQESRRQGLQRGIMHVAPVILLIILTGIIWWELAHQNQF